MISDVQNAICVSETPRFLYIIELAPESATKGKPIANQVVGIQYIGCIVFFFSTLKGIWFLNDYYQGSILSKKKLTTNLLLKYFNNETKIATFIRLNMHIE